MKTENKIMVLALALGFLTWVFDAYVDYFFFYDASFSDSLFAKVSAHETYMRLVVVCSLLMFGVIASGFAKQLREREAQLQGVLAEAQGRQAETAALLGASRAVMEHRTFADAARAIFDHCREIIGAPAGYISLADATGASNEVVFLEAGGLPCVVDPGTPMPIRGLRAEAYQEGRAIYDNNFSQSVYTAFLPEGHVTVENVMFAPLALEGKAIGLLGLANKPGGFTDHDAVLVSGFAELAAIALVNKRAEEERERLIQEVEAERSFLTTVVEHMPAGIAIAEAPSGKLILGNKELKNIWRFADLPTDLKDCSSQVQILHPDGQTYSLEEWPLVRSLEHGEVVNGEEAEVIRKDGSRGTLRVSSAPIRDSQGKVKAGVSTCIDITERRRAEEALKQAYDELERRVQERTAELRHTVEQLQMEIGEREIVEGKLKESEARFRTLFQTAGSFILSVSPENRILEFNEEAQRLSGWQRQEVVGKDSFDLFVQKEHLPLAEAELARVVAGEMTRGFEFLIKVRDGGERYFLWNANLLRDASGQPREVIIVGQDITSRKLAEEALREQSRILEAFFEHTITPLVFLDREFNFIRVNEAYARACHREVPEFLGLNHFDLYPHEENQAIFANVVKTKTPYQAMAKPFVFPDHPEWGVTYWDWTLVPILDERGDVDFLVFSQNDVTQRVLAEEHKAQLIEIIEATPDFVGTADLKGRILYVNKAGRLMLGFTEDEDLSHLRIVNTHSPETRKFIIEKALPVARRQGVWQGETRFLARDGREIPTSQVILVHQGANGKEAFYSTIARDISNIKQAEQKLRRLTSQLLKAQEKERRRLSRELHDELGQSLLVLKMQARSIERKLPQGQDILREDCNRALKYIDEIIENVRRLSRDLTPVVLEDLGLSAALNYLFDEFRRHHGTINFVVEQDPEAELIPKDAQINIFRIFQESLTNIAKYAQATQVRVSLKKQGDRLLGIVEDEGAGFEVAEVLAREGYGKGLGLAAMDERVRILGGSLHISSERGKGTRVEFTVPLGKQEA